MIILEDEKFYGDGQVLSGFFKYHQSSQTAPTVTSSDEDHLYRLATIDVGALSYIIQSRGWKLPSISTSQVSDLIDKLKSGKSPDYYGLSVLHVKNGGSISVLFLTKYLNLTFKYIEYGVSEEELIGTASMIFKGKGKSLTNPKSFRKITVCALLGKIKEMAICDLSIPIIRPRKAFSQLGFTAGLYVKLSNIIVTEKRALAYEHNKIVLHMFLDADAAFDRCLHPIMLRGLNQDGLHDDAWKYFQQCMKNLKPIKNGQRRCQQRDSLKLREPDKAGWLGLWNIASM